MAQTIVATLSIKGKQDGYIEGGGYLISQCVGYLIQLVKTAAYGEQYKKWSSDGLPIPPEEWQYTADSDRGKQFRTIKEFMYRVDISGAMDACDTGHEGGLILRFVYEVAGCKKPMCRLWILSMEDGATRADPASLKDGRDYGTPFTSVLYRAGAGWFIGINATRPFSCLYGKTLNVGRVQIPALKMLTDRDTAISHFQKEKYHHIRLDLSGTDAASERTSDKAETDILKGAYEAGKVVCASPTGEEETTVPPKFFDLTSLQRETDRIFGHTVKQTPGLTQPLYKERLLTCPRADSSFPTDDMGGTAADIIVLPREKLPFMAGADFTPEITKMLSSKKVSGHYITIPTMKLVKAGPDVLPESEKNIFTLAGARLLLATVESHTYEAVTAVFSRAGTDSTARGKTILAEGQKRLERRYRATLKNKSEAGDRGNEGVTLPELSEGQNFPNPAAKVTRHTTTPPKPHSGVSLLSTVERAGNGDTDPDVERRGLGTPTTCTAVIEKLVKGGFAEHRGRQLIPTRNGAALISVLPDMLVSPQLAAEQKNNLMQIAKGAADPGEFLPGTEAMTREPIQTYTAALGGKKDLFREEKPSADKRPRCGSPVHEGKKNYYCSSKEYTFAMWKDDRFFKERKTAFSVKVAAALPESGKVNIEKLYPPKIGKAYGGAIALAGTGGKYVNYRIEVQRN